MPSHHMPKFLFHNRKTDDFVVIKAADVGMLPHPLSVPHLEFVESNQIYKTDTMEVIGEHPVPSWDRYELLNLDGD